MLALGLSLPLAVPQHHGVTSWALTNGVLREPLSELQLQLQQQQQQQQLLIA